MLKSTLKKILPKPVKKVIQRLLNKSPKISGHLRESTTYADIGVAGPLVVDLFSRIKDVPGWFNLDDCGHFYLLLSCQSAMGVKGDLLEIGSYHGRSTALMAACLRPKERIVVCDAFESDTNDYYSDKPSPEVLISNLERLSPELKKDRIIIHKCLSNDLQLDAEERFRFVHIDGGHSAEQAYFDLNLCSKHMHPNGVMVMDDYHHISFPGVAQGTDRFLKENKNFSVLADLNRHGASGRKLYLINNKDF